MTELYGEFFASLRLAKKLYDCGLAEQFKESFESQILDGDDYWTLAYEAAGWVFQDTCQYYNEEAEIETWLFTDPVIDRFCELCREYETRQGICEEQNSYRRDMAGIIRENFSFNSYSYNYDWRLSSKDRGRKCLLLFIGCEFYSSDEVPAGLLEIKNGFCMLNEKLECELAEMSHEEAA